LVPPNEPSAALAESLIGVIVGVGHLSIGHPHDSVSISPQRDGVLQNGTIDPITNVACRPALGSTAPIGEKPRVWMPHGIAWSMAVPNDGDAWYFVEQRFKLGLGNVH